MAFAEIWDGLQCLQGRWMCLEYWSKCPVADKGRGVEGCVGQWSYSHSSNLILMY